MILLDILDFDDKTSPFKNCLRKNYRHLKKWAKRVNTDCFRIYNREINHYPFAIDVYAGRFCIHFFSRDRENLEPSETLKQEVVSALKELFGVNETEIYFRSRFRRKKDQQYEKVAATKDFFHAVEFGVKFRINLVDYLDTGLFLDHRETRKMVASLAKDKKLLNLFAYTCSFSVHAAHAGAKLTKSVDMSNTYLAWGKENFLLNSLNMKNNKIVRADCLKFLDEETQKYDLIVIDPPTISRSKKMDQMFDVQEDYITLITKSLGLLADGGTIFFSTNSRKFSFDSSLFEEFTVQEISRWTLPCDFSDPKIHRCWKITKKT
ncbi:MAG: Ribosomal RNA large subunit methyltransferase K [Chlamydiia bacterium]|nr:Ribosomal RNA large subunit methyltransferase K [Chlamydiia bacterium]MCH9615285.1 Ribosomal RNA large subunit methyltransferase K [Chlamydiia bacterium]MCH9628393.1 Ribosomal RNA large subunit methyltransferase K [Chlamydiia bacterium]